MNLTNEIPAQRRVRGGMIGGERGRISVAFIVPRCGCAIVSKIVAGAFSSDFETNRETATALDIEEDRCYRSFAEMAGREAGREDRIEVAIIVTPNHLHFEPSRLFLEAGIPGSRLSAKSRWSTSSKRHESS